MDEITEAYAATDIEKRNTKLYNNKKFGNSNTGTIKNKKDIECYYCHKRGHFARECRKRKGSRNYARNNNGNANQTLSGQGIDSDKHGAFVVTDSNIEENVLHAMLSTFDYSTAVLVNICHFKDIGSAN